MLAPAANLFTGTDDPVLAFEPTENTLTQFCPEAETRPCFDFTLWGEEPRALATRCRALRPRDVPGYGR
jgi:hypothetical protein